MLAHKLLKRATKTANSRGNESRIAKQDSKIFPRIVETANGKPANGEGYLYICNEMIEETAGRRRLIFGMWESFGYGSTKL